MPTSTLMEKKRAKARAEMRTRMKILPWVKKKKVKKECVSNMDKATVMMTVRFIWLFWLPVPPLEEVGVQVDRETAPEKAVIQTVMFDTIKLLQAYMPDPDSDIEWFKRVLKDVKVAQVTEDKEWYPFGCPPMVRHSLDLHWLLQRNLLSNVSSKIWILTPNKLHRQSFYSSSLQCKKDKDNSIWDLNWNHY